MDTPERIERLLETRGIPEHKRRGMLAKLCGITPQAVGQWWTTTSRISPEYLGKIADKWGTTTDWLIMGKGQMDSQKPPTVEGLLDQLAELLYTNKEAITKKQIAGLRFLLESLERRASTRAQDGDSPSDK